MVFHKNKDWEYEQELRKVFVLAKLMKKPLDKSTVGYFLRMPPDCIANVIFGARCPDDQVHSVRAVLKRSHFAHVRVERASLHSGRYALEFTTLP